MPSPVSLVIIAGLSAPLASFSAQKPLIPIAYENFMGIFFSPINLLVVRFLVRYLLLALFRVVSFAESFKGAISKIW